MATEEKKSESLKLIVGAAVMLVALAVIVYQLLPSASPLTRDKWMFDLATGTLVRAEASELSPMAGGGTFDYPGMGEGPSIVDASVFTCGDPSDIEAGMTVEALAEVGARIGFLTRLTPQSRQAMEAAVQASRGGEAADPDAGRTGGGSGATTVLSAVDGKRWVGEMSPPAMKIRAAAAEPCDDASAPTLTRPS